MLYPKTSAINLPAISNGDYCRARIFEEDNGLLKNEANASFCYILLTAASIKPLNNGCGLSGLDLNSGWN